MILPNILTSINSLLPSNYLTVSDRYFEHKYCVNVGGKNNAVNQRVSFHTNRICLLSLAENHPIIKKNKHIVGINYEIDKQVNRLKNAMTGKGKRGAQKLYRDSIICFIECYDGSLYPVYSCIKGKLIEVNETLVTHPNLLKVKPVSEGYIALLLPILSIYDDTKKSMLTRNEYLSLSESL